MELIDPIDRVVVVILDGLRATSPECYCSRNDSRHQFDPQNPHPLCGFSVL